MSALEWRVRGVLDLKLDVLGHIGPEEFCTDDKGGVNACGDATAGDAVTVDHDAVRCWCRAECLQKFQVRPVGRGSVAAQEAGGAEDQRSRAYATYPSRPVRLRRQEGE